MDKIEDKINEKQKTDEWLTEEYIREAETIIQEVLEKDDVLPDDQIDVEGSYERLIARMKQEGVYREDTGEVQAKQEPEAKIPPKTAELVKVKQKPDCEKEKKTKKIFTRKLAKAAGFIFVIAAGVFAGSMTSEANRNYILESVSMLVGKDVRVNVMNDKSQDIVDLAEEEARSEISNKIGIEVPIFMYRPDKLKFKDYFIDSVINVGNIDYSYGEMVINLRMQKSVEEISSVSSFHGDVIDEVFIKNLDGVTAKFYEVKEKTDQIPSYIVQWELDNISYQLSGKLELEEMRKIVQGILF